MMTRDKRVAILAIAVTATIGLMAGCGKPTPASIAKDVVKALDKVESMDGEMEMIFDGKISDVSGSGISVDMAMELNAEYQAIITPEAAAYMEATMTISAMSMEESVDVESYTVKGDEGYDVYTLTDDIWTKSTAEDFESKNESMVQKNIYEGIAGEKLEATLEEDLEKINGKEAYVLNVTIDGDYINEVFSTIGDLSEGMVNDDIDSKTKLDAKVYIYKDANVPAKIEMDCKNLADDMFASQDETASIKVDEFTLTMTMNSYNNVDEIEVPKEAVNNATEIDTDQDFGNLFGDADEEDFDDTDDTDDLDGELEPNADGNYVITNYEETLQAEIGLPENYEHSYSAPNYLAAEKETEDYDISATYTFEDYGKMEDMAKELGDYTYFEEDEDYKDIEKTPEATVTVNGMEIHYITVKYIYSEEYKCIDVFAWTKTSDDSPFLVELELFGYSESADINAEEVIQEIYSKVKL